MDNRPIGIMDSGVGGLTVIRLHLVCRRLSLQVKFLSSA